MVKRVLTITSSYYQYNDHAIPNIRLLGKWLQVLGFQIGEKVEVYYSQEKPDELVIRKIGEIRHRI